LGHSVVDKCSTTCFKVAIGWHEIATLQQKMVLRAISHAREQEQ